MFSRIISIWNWAEIVTVITLWTLVVAFFYVVTGPFDRVRRITGRWFRRGAMLIITLNPMWRVRCSGHRVPRREGPFVVVSNHQSIADVAVLSHLPWEMKWLSKESNFRLPVFGWMMRMAGDIPLRRGDKESARRAMARCRWYLDNGMSVMVFPEGSRTGDGAVRPFKEGAFRLAVEAGRSILPVVVAGTRDAIPKRSWIFGGKSNMRIHVLPPVSVAELELTDVPSLTEKVRSMILEGLETLQLEHEHLPTAA